MKVAVIMGSTSDWGVMSAAVETLEQLGIEYEKRVISAHRTPHLMFEYATTARERGIGAIIAGAGGAAHVAGVTAGLTTVPVIGVPIRSSFDGMDSLLAIVQMPPGIPVATVGVNGALNAAILAAQILATGDNTIADKMENYKSSLTDKIVKANEELSKIEYKFKTN